MHYRSCGACYLTSLAVGATGFKGGAVQNAVHALARWVSTLHDPSGGVTVAHFYECAFEQCLLGYSMQFIFWDERLS